MIVVAGGSGYVGSRLVRRLVATGDEVRVLSRSGGEVEGASAVAADVRDARALASALAGAEALVYLVHGLGAPDFEEQDRAAAHTVVEAAASADVGRIVYLGGLAHGDGLSPHLASRQEVGAILRAGPVPAAEVRASIVLGPGSASYELLRFVVDNVVAAPLPSWMDTPSQPIAVADVVAYLAAALAADLPASRVWEVGGADRLTYVELMQRYASAAGLRRAYVTLPTPQLPGSSWLQEVLAAVTPEQARIWLRLVESLRTDTSVHDDAARRDLPSVSPIGVAEALQAGRADAAAAAA